jgi:U1 small nuclear ribonucleoprotein 70kDa
MPGTHLLPGNLLKLFAPRPQLPWMRPVDRDVDRITKKDVSGVGQILQQLKEANTETLMKEGESDAMEEGEEPIFTHAEEVKRQIRREERKARRTEEFKIAKETCQWSVFFHVQVLSDILFQINLPTTPKPLVIPIRPCLYLVW